LPTGSELLLISLGTLHQPTHWVAAQTARARSIVIVLCETVLTISVTQQSRRTLATPETGSEKSFLKRVVNTKFNH
jgi:hypothetical protein